LISIFTRAQTDSWAVACPVQMADRAINVHPNNLPVLLRIPFPCYIASTSEGFL
jgi:hypothetical protein